MVTIASSSPIPFILFRANRFPGLHSALPGEKSGCSFSIHRLTRSAPCPWPGRILLCLILFWLLLQAKLCYAGVICTSWCSSSGTSRPTVRRAIDMLQHVTAHHLTRLACLYVRQSTLQQ